VAVVGAGHPPAQACRGAGAAGTWLSPSPETPSCLWGVNETSRGRGQPPWASSPRPQIPPPSVPAQSWGLTPSRADPHPGLTPGPGLAPPRAGDVAAGWGRGPGSRHGSTGLGCSEHPWGFLSQREPIPLPTLPDPAQGPGGEVMRGRDPPSENPRSSPPPADPNSPLTAADRGGAKAGPSPTLSPRPWGPPAARRWGWGGPVRGEAGDAPEPAAAVPSRQYSSGGDNERCLPAALSLPWGAWGGCR